MVGSSAATITAAIGNPLRHDDGMVNARLSQRWSVVWLIALSVVTSACAATPTPLLNVRGTPLPPLPTLDAAQVVRGRELYQTHCATCHGAKAEGAPNWQKADVQGNYPPPPHDDSGHTWHHPDRVLYEIIHDGFADPLRPGSPLRMPAFGDKLDDAEVRMLIAYFKSLWSAEHRAFQWEVTLEDKTPMPNR